MKVLNIKYRESTPSTKITIYTDDGHEWMDDLEIVADSQLRYRRDEWIAGGGTIEMYVAPPKAYPPLTRLTFWLAAAEIGVTKDRVRNIMNVLPAGPPRDQALAYLDEAQTFRRDDPLLNRIATVDNISQQELDHLWDWATASYG